MIDLLYSRDHYRSNTHRRIQQTATEKTRCSLAYHPCYHLLSENHAAIPPNVHEDHLLFVFQLQQKKLLQIQTYLPI